MEIYNQDTKASQGKEARKTTNHTTRNTGKRKMKNMSNRKMTHTEKFTGMTWEEKYNILPLWIKDIIGNPPEQPMIISCREADNDAGVETILCHKGEVEGVFENPLCAFQSLKEKSKRKNFIFHASCQFNDGKNQILKREEVPSFSDVSRSLECLRLRTSGDGKLWGDDLTQYGDTPTKTLVLSAEYDWDVIDFLARKYATFLDNLDEWIADPENDKKAFLAATCHPVFWGASHHPDEENPCEWDWVTDRTFDGLDIYIYFDESENDKEVMWIAEESDAIRESQCRLRNEGREVYESKICSGPVRITGEAKELKDAIVNFMKDLHRHYDEEGELRLKAK